MIKYFFSDIDGTLFVNEDVSPLDVAAAHEFVRRGGAFSLATGRADLEIEQFSLQEGFPQSRFRISANGAMSVDGELIDYQGFSPRAKLFLKEHLEEVLTELAVVEISTPNHIYFLMEPEAWVLNYKNDSYTIDSSTLDAFTSPDFNILKMYLEGKEEFVADFIRKIEADFSDEIDIFNDVTAVNIVPKNKSKGAAIRNIMKAHNIKPEEIATIGDAANDLSMFEITPNSFTFDYSAEFVQDRAAHIVPNVATAINHILLANRKSKKNGE